MLKKHLIKIRSLPDFMMCRFVFCPEANLGYEAQNVANKVREWNMDPISFIMDDKKNDNMMTDGVRIYQALKEQLVYDLRDRFVEKSVYLYEGFFAIGRDGTDATLEEFERQILSFTRVVVKRKNGDADLYNKPRVEFTGKLSGQDDMFCAFMLITYAHRAFTTGEAFVEFRKIHPAIARRSLHDSKTRNVSLHSMPTSIRRN